jgi:hypothetical protein
MKTALTLSAITGLAWGLIAYFLIGGDFVSGIPWSMLIAGAVAGILAGAHTVRSRKKKEGKEGTGSVFACYYLSIVVFWSVWFVFDRGAMCISHGGWTDFDLKDSFLLLVYYLLLGTVPYGLAFVPLCFLNRWLVWRAFRWQTS